MKTAITLLIGLLLVASISLNADATVITRTLTEQGSFHNSYSLPGPGVLNGSIPINPFPLQYGQLVKTDIKLDSRETSVVKPVCDAQNCFGDYAFHLNTIRYDLSNYKLPPVIQPYPLTASCGSGCRRGPGAETTITTPQSSSLSIINNIVGGSTPVGGDIPYTISYGNQFNQGGHIEGQVSIDGTATVTRTYHPPLVNIYADAFIPAATVPNPLSLGIFESDIRSFAGDNRGFQEFGSFRFYQAITVDLNPFDDPVVSHQHDTGVTIGNTIRGTRTAKASTSGLTESATNAGGIVSIHLHGEAGNPFIPFGNFAVPIFQDYIIDLSINDFGLINYNIVGNTKDFPAHELYIGCQLIKGIGTPSLGTTPTALLFPPTHTVMASGQISMSDAADCDLPSVLPVDEPSSILLIVGMVALGFVLSSRDALLHSTSTN